ncbi:hypothetical protein ACH5RR_041187 [Cinchona calisaya]|uniref:MULE transposase domain-containing protein n=1 Tax=Cinchona calisaya TaxID=153742 RepID=A0ABD2XW75_9GENT
MKKMRKYSTDYTNKLSDKDKDTNSIIDVSQEKQLDQENQPLTINFHDLLSISSETFSCHEDLIGSVREIVLRHKYAITIKRSTANRYVIIGCDRGGKYRRAHIPIEQRKKITSSRLINCPFEVWGKKKVDGFWKVEVKNLQHNHEPSSDMSGHPSCRHFSKKEIQHIREMSKAGILPRQILASLRQGNLNLQAISRTIYNAKAKIRKENLMGRTAIQALFDEFAETGFVYDIEHDDKEIIGVSSFNTSFYSCFVAMQKEEESDYIWALERFKKLLGVGKNPSVIVTDSELALMNAIEIVFPSTTNLLCVWHIEKNILFKCKKYFEEKEAWDTFILSWTNLIKYTDEITFLEGWKLLEVDQKE